MHNPITIRRLEATAIFVAGLITYQQMGFGWGLFAALFFVPDLALFGYALGKNFGNRLYNTTHFALPLSLLVVALFYQQMALLLCVDLGYHIALTACWGWGLKTTSFYHTDMGDKKVSPRAGFINLIIRPGQNWRFGLS